MWVDGGGRGVGEWGRVIESLNSKKGGSAGSLSIAGEYWIGPDKQPHRPWWGNNGAGSLGHDLSSASDKQPVWPKLGYSQVQTLVPGPVIRCGVDIALPSSYIHHWPTSHLYLAILWECVSTNRCKSSVLVQNVLFCCAFTLRSSSVCQDVGSANSMVIYMFLWYTLNWLSNLNPLTQTGMSCNVTWLQEENNLLYD